ncbi:MAG: hypothetical protein RLZZ210_461 [Pseudomonadota bacterium]|jgi:hypothetical protein
MIIKGVPVQATKTFNVDIKQKSTESILGSLKVSANLQEKDGQKYYGWDINSCSNCNLMMCTGFFDDIKSDEDPSEIMTSILVNITRSHLLEECDLKGVDKKDLSITFKENKNSEDK